MADKCDTLTESDLARLVNDPVLKDCNHWEDIGVELGVTEYDSNKIKADCHGIAQRKCEMICNLSEFKDCIHWEDVGLELVVAKRDINKIKADHQRIADRKREMINVWLQNGENPTLEELKEAIKRVKERHEREAHRYYTATEENKAIESVNRLERLLDDWEVTNQKILTDQSRLVTELKEDENKWFQTVKKWNDEKAEWDEGDTGKQRRDIMNTLQHGVNVRNAFVKNLLRSKGYDSSNMENYMVEGILRQTLMEIDIDRSRTIGIRYQEMKMHNKQLEHLKTEIMESKTLLDERLRVYEKIREGLIKIGMKTESLEKLNAQLQSLQETTKKYISTIDECDIIYQQEIDNWNKELRAFLESFNANIRLMTKLEQKFVDALIILFTGAAGAAGGAVMGGVLGTMLVPGVGTAVGTVLGGVAGSVTGLVYGTQKAEEAKAKLDRNFKNYRDTLNKGKSRMNRLRHIYAS